MENVFQKLRLKERKPHAQKSFEQALFGGFAPWYLTNDNDPPVVEHAPEPPEQIISEERTQVLEKLQDFAVNTIEGSEVTEISFPGGSLKLKGPPRLRVVHYDSKFSPKPMPKDLSAERPFFLCLGETDEPAQAQLLTKMLAAMKLDQFSVWRIKEPGVDEDEEVWLGEIVSTLWHVQPVFILSVGALVTNILLSQKERLSRIHGQFFDLQVTNSASTSFLVPMVPIFHPEFLLINPKMKQSTWTDLQNVMNHLGLNTP